MFSPIRTVHKTEEAPHVQFLDRMEEIPVLMQVSTIQKARHPWKFTERIVDVRVVLRRQIQYPDTDSYDPKMKKKMYKAEVQKDPNVSPQVQSTFREEGADKDQTHHEPS